MELEDLKVGSKVMFIGEEVRFNKYVTKDKVYTICELGSNLVIGVYASFIDDRGGDGKSIISKAYLHLFVEVRKSPVEEKRLLGTSDFSAALPEHYHHGGIDVFKYGEANFSHEAVAGFYRMNIIKYVTRYDKKNGIEDLEKALTYLKALTELEEKKNAEKC